MLKILLTFGVVFIIFSSKAQTYNESDISNYLLPEVLKTSSGKKINKAKDWENLRRPEIISLFENYVYGQVPKHFDRIVHTVVRENTMALDGRATLKEIQIEVSIKQHSIKINLVLFIPNKRQGPAPVFVLINHRDKSHIDPQRITKSDFWPAEMAIDSSYAIAAFHVSDVAIDDKEAFKNGVLSKLYPEQLQLANGMRTIGTWAWAASRVMDYFITDKDIDSKKVAVVGHSRGGKAALWAAAKDTRFAIPFINCAGNTGTALSRRKFGETVKSINDKFPHWFTDNYKHYNDQENSLPIDQHMLIALIAPRPVYITNASKDLWADPKGTYLALKYAEPVYELYFKKIGLPIQPPPINTYIKYSAIGYHNREGIHDMTKYDWINFIRFADQLFYNKK